MKNKNTMKTSRFRLAKLASSVFAVSFALSTSGAIAENELRIATSSSGENSFTFVPTGCGGDQQNWLTLMYQAPLYFDKDNNLKPGVLNEWSSNEEKTVWTFKIDSRAKFSDGSPVTATDAKRTWEIMASSGTCGRAGNYIGNVKGFDAVSSDASLKSDMSGIKAIDSSTIVMHLQTPDPAFHYRIATSHMNIVKAEDAVTLGLDSFWKPENNPKVTGPYMLSVYEPDRGNATLVPNPNWWLDEGPYLDAVKFQFVEDAQTVGVMALNNQIDASLQKVPNVFKDQLPGFFRPIDTYGFNTFWLRPEAEPTNDINVRKALALAVDWNAVFEATFLEGDGTPSTQALDPAMQQDPSQKGYPYDVEAAKAAIAASSYGSVENLPKIRVSPRGSDEYNYRALQVVIEFWRKNLNLTNVEFQERPQAFGDDWRTLTNLSRDDVVIRFPDPATYIFAAGHSKGAVPSSSMLAGYSNNMLDSYLDEALQLEVVDPRRLELAYLAQKAYLDDYVLLHFGKATPTLNAREYVKNYFRGPDISLIEPWKIKVAK